jgi:hypothetical protein
MWDDEENVIDEKDEAAEEQGEDEISLQEEKEEVADEAMDSESEKSDMPR